MRDFRFCFFLFCLAPQNVAAVSFPISDTITNLKINHRNWSGISKSQCSFDVNSFLFQFSSFVFFFSISVYLVFTWPVRAAPDYHSDKNTHRTEFSIFDICKSVSKNRTPHLTRSFCLFICCCVRVFSNNRN